MTKTEIHKTICDSMNALYAAKNADYNDSYAKLREKFGNTAILVRLNDKLSRLEQLMKPGYEAKVQDEKIEDTLMDLANYAVMELTEIRADQQFSETLRRISGDVWNGTDGLRTACASTEPNQDMPEKQETAIYGITEDGKEIFGDTGDELCDLEICYDGEKYTMFLETIYWWEDWETSADAEGSLLQWLDGLKRKLSAFVRQKEPNGTYELRYDDDFSIAGPICGATLTEVATKFAFYVNAVKGWVNRA